MAHVRWCELSWTGNADVDIEERRRVTCSGMYELPISEPADVCELTGEPTRLNAYCTTLYRPKRPFIVRPLATTPESDLNYSPVRTLWHSSTFAVS